MASTTPQTFPALNADGTISAIVQDVQELAHAGTLLRLWLPLAYHEGGGFGRFFLIRCAEDTLDARAHEWSFYGRRALFCAAMPTAMPEQAGSQWTLAIPEHGHTSNRYSSDAAYQWLVRRPINTSLNLLGPFGQRFELAAHTRTLLALATLRTLPLILPVVHTMLDRGGRVTLLVRGDAGAAAPLLSLIPIPVEVRFIPADDGQEPSWLNHLAGPVRWADQLCAVLPNADYAPLAHHIRSLRFQLDTSFAHVLVSSDLLCGVGACLACVISTKESAYTRACLHGPVFPLSTLAP
jgi:hypothetical protein